MSFYGRSSNPLRMADFLARRLPGIESRPMRTLSHGPRPSIPGAVLAAMAVRGPQWPLVCAAILSVKARMTPDPTNTRWMMTSQ